MESYNTVVPNLFGTRGRFRGRQLFHVWWGCGGWFLDDSRALHYCALYFYYYYIVIYNEKIIQLTIMQNQWEPWACFHLPLLIGFWYESASSWFIMVSMQSYLSANDDLYLQLLPSASITASAPPQINMVINRSSSFTSSLFPLNQVFLLSFKNI